MQALGHHRRRIRIASANEKLRSSNAQWLISLPRFAPSERPMLQESGMPAFGAWPSSEAFGYFRLAEGHVKARQVKRVKTQGESTWLRIVLAEGRNREVRRMLARLSHKVLRLRRIALGPIQLGTLARGKARRLSPVELGDLKAAARGVPSKPATTRPRRSRG